MQPCCKSTGGFNCLRNQWSYVTRAVIRERFDMRRVALILAVIGVALAVVSCGNIGVTEGSTLSPPSKAEAHGMLSQLVIAPEGSAAGYSRDEFPHWSIVDGECDTREQVLRRDGTAVAVGPDCYPVSGEWVSPYDGATWHDPTDIDIDHMVPLAEAWRSGASVWTESQREAFANDLSSPQLLAVTDNVNQSKGDQSPDEWKPQWSYWCEYAAMWVDVKYTWSLTATDSEVSELTLMLDTC